MRSPLVYLATILATVTACGVKEPPSQLKNIFGTDDRSPVNASEYPATTIGRFDLIQGGHCTGTLVSRRLILTAAHCIYDKDGNAHGGTFHPNYKYGRSRGSAEATRVWAGTRFPNGTRSKDWALVALDRDLGEDFGWLGVRKFNVTTHPGRLTVAGYAANYRDGETAGVHHNCLKRKVVFGTMYHDCDSGRGASGGPVLRQFDGKLTVTGVNVSEFRGDGETSLHVDHYEHRYANIAIATEDFFPKLLELQDAGY